MKKTGFLIAIAASASALAATHAGVAEACGGCFVPPSDATVVTDHRMAFSISQKETILWDQIRYSGDPREFAWVLPVKPGATIELANDEFFAALDASTQPITYAPRTYNGGFGCLNGCASDSESSSLTDSNGASGGVQIISQSVVGPYETVTLRSTDDDALVSWLRKNSFAIPTSIEPTIGAYVTEKFDFIALKLRPNCGERSMKPVRVITPGAVPVLPLRMVAAGVGPKVGITLYVITEGKYQPQNFPHVTIPDDRLRWNRFENKSNYETLSQELMAQAEGRTWIIEYADKPQLPLTEGWQNPYNLSQNPSSTTFSGITRTPGLAFSYYAQCKNWSGYGSAVRPGSSGGFGGGSSGFGGGSSSFGGSSGINVTPCPESDAGLPGRDAGSSGNDAGGGLDAGDKLDSGSGDDAGDAGDAGNQQGDDDDDQTSSSSSSSSSSGFPGSSSGSSFENPNCDFLDDLDRSLDGLNRPDVWLTRMRSSLPATVLTGGDLVVEPSKLADGRADVEIVSNLHWTPYYADDDQLSDEEVKSNCMGTPRYRRPYASYTALGIFFVSMATAYARRRRRPRRNEPPKS